MPKRERDLPRPIFLPPRSIPLDPPIDPEMGPLSPDRLISSTGIAVNRRGRIMHIEVVGLRAETVEEYTSEMRVAFGYQRSRRNAPAIQAKSGPADRPAFVDKRAVAAQLENNPNDLIILLDFAGSLRDASARNLALARDHYRDQQSSVWTQSIASRIGLTLNDPSPDRFDLAFVIDPTVSAGARQRYQRMQAHSITLSVDVSQGSGSVTASLEADGKPQPSDQTIQTGGTAIASWSHTSAARHSLYQLIVTGGSGGGKYQVTGLWKDFTYQDEFVDVASRGTIIL